MRRFERNFVSLWNEKDRINGETIHLIQLLLTRDDTEKITISDTQLRFLWHILTLIYSSFLSKLNALHTWTVADPEPNYGSPATFVFFANDAFSRLGLGNVVGVVENLCCWLLRFGSSWKFCKVYMQTNKMLWNFRFHAFLYSIELKTPSLMAISLWKHLNLPLLNLRPV